jgi:hypothetical protein
LIFWNFLMKLAVQGQLIISSQTTIRLIRVSLIAFILTPFFASAQQTDGLKTDTGKLKHTEVVTRVSGRVTDFNSGQPLAGISISFTGSTHATTTDIQGNYSLSAPGSYRQVSFSYMGYSTVVNTINPGQDNVLSVQLKKTEHQLNEVMISAKGKRYRNKGNPAVELIQQIINHKSQNRMTSADYLQYDQYERTALSFFDISSQLLNSRFFSKYKFLLDSNSTIDGVKKTSMPVFFSEKISQYYYRKDPSKSIQVLKAQKDINMFKFIDTAGVNVYLNRLYGNNIDIYSNNIFIINRQFLSPIADHAPDFYKFFIRDTIKTATGKLIEVGFTPRNKGDLLFEGTLLVTMDGRYAVESCELEVNKQINVNFMRSLKVRQDFKQYPDGHYFLIKSNAKADFGILKDKGMGVYGERTVVFSNYKLNTPLAADFYRGKSLQTAVDPKQSDTAYWAHSRTDTLTKQQTEVYAKIGRLEKMSSFKRLTWLAATFTGGYANLGPVQLGQIGSLYSFNSQEGSRFQVGGRTTPEFNKTIYLEGYTAYGTRDKVAKYNLTTYFSLNKTAPYRFPNDYFKLSYLYDVDLPGQSFTINNSQAALTSFHTGKTDYWLYNKIFTFAYVKDFENHLSYHLAFKNWNQQAAGTLLFQSNDNNSIVKSLNTSEIELGVRYAPHEQILQGTEYRRTIHSKYPILNLQINHGIKGMFDSPYSYTNIGLNIYKRFYLSQLGYTDVTLLGNLIAGKVPFPLLNISPANQSIAYDPSAYNQMNYLEFVSDHYAGINMTQSFNGFFLNKIPLIEHLKWREYLSLKVLYGGLRNENNPLYSKNLYYLPAASGNANGTYSLGDTPYVEAGAGVGNIFKFLRVDMIRRFNYLDHQGVSQYGVKLSFSPHL